jgi:hypothetical protein
MDLNTIIFLNQITQIVVPEKLGFNYLPYYFDLSKFNKSLRCIFRKNFIS